MVCFLCPESGLNFEPASVNPDSGFTPAGLFLNPKSGQDFGPIGALPEVDFGRLAESNSLRAVLLLEKRKRICAGTRWLRPSHQLRAPEESLGRATRLFSKELATSLTLELTSHAGVFELGSTRHVLRRSPEEGRLTQAARQPWRLWGDAGEFFEELAFKAWAMRC